MNHDDNVDQVVRANDATAGDVIDERPTVVPSSSNDIRGERLLGKKSLLRLDDKLRKKAMENGESIANPLRRRADVGKKLP